MDKKTLLLIGFGGVLAFFLWKKLTGVASAASAALTHTGEAIGESVFDVFHPDPVGEMLFYTVHFSDGNHAVASSDVDAAGNFTFRGKKFVMRDKVNAQGIKEHWAFAP